MAASNAGGLRGLLDDIFENDYREDGFRTCSVTNLEIHRSAEVHAKLFALTAVIALTWGGIFAITVPLTRWEVIGLLEAGEFYTHLSLHAWNLLIFWMVFMEIAILYVGGPMVLGRKLPLTRLAKVGWVTMVVGAVSINYSIWTTSAPDAAPLLTSYAPLPSDPLFYAGAIVFLLGTTIAALPFFASVWQYKRANRGVTLPLVTFGAFITAIIAVEAILGGLVVFAYALAWRIELIGSIDAALYRQIFWIIGHGSQQINLVAMITVWYFLTHVVGGAEIVSEKVSRTAFILYLFFINMGAAHHLLSDPAVTTGWRVFNTSYAFYGATFASLIHAFAIPAGIEAGRRKRGLGGGLFGWLTNAPWKNPVFSSTIFAIILFGFVGGITGVLMGQLQLNMTWHNTMATVGHFHGTVVLGTTVTFMGLTYFALRTMFMRGFVSDRLASIQPYFYAGTMSVATLMLLYTGILYGVPRRTNEVVQNIPTTDFSIAAAAPLFNVFGIFAVLAVIGGALFVVVAVGTLLFGKQLEPGDNADLVPRGGLYPDGGGVEMTAGVDESAEASEDGETGFDPDPVHAYEMRGTFVLCLVFLATFAIMYVLNWYLLTQLWSIGA